MTERTRTPMWLWIAVGLTMIILGLWLAYFLIVNPFARSDESASAVATASVDLAVKAATASIATPIALTDEPVAESSNGVTDAVAAAAQVSEPALLEPSPTPMQSQDVPAQNEMPTATLTPAPPTVAPPTPTDTSTPHPEQRLLQGNEQYRLGNYTAARTQYLSLITAPEATTDQRLQAQFEAAKSYLAEGLPGETLSLLEQLQTLAGENAASAVAGDVLAKAEYLRADALAQLERYDEAAQAYARFLAAYPETATTIQPKLGRIYLSQGNIEAGNTAYYAATASATDAVHKVLLLEELAGLHTDAGRDAQAAAAWDAILEIAQMPGYRARVQNNAGNAYAAAGDDSTAISRWQSAIAEAQVIYQSTDESITSAAKDSAIGIAYEALVELVNREVPFDQYERGLIDIEAEAYLPAVSAFQAFLESAAADDVRYAAGLHGLAQAYLGLGQADDAQATLNRVLNEYPSYDDFGQVMLDLAQVEVVRGDSAAARRAYRTFARDYPNDALAPEAMWRSGISALNEGSNIEGAVDLIALADAFPNSELAPQALFWVGMGAYGNDLYPEAVNVFQRLQREYPDHRWDAVAFWLGRAQHELGDYEGANATWAQLVNRAPDIYYGILAAYSKESIQLSGGSMLMSMNAIAGPATTLAGDDGSQAFADQWMANWLQTDPAAVAQLPDAVQNDADLQTGRLLLDLDARGDALEALQRVYERYQGDAQTLYALSLEFERLGAYQLSLQSMAYVLALSPANLVQDGPIFMQQRIYPRPFRVLITEQAIANNIDPLLLFSLIRQESLFEEGARSVAAAQGLAQIIPDTGHWIAEQLGYPNYTNDLVYRPMINVRFGAYYLDWVRDYLDGNIVSALVGYNAGPGNSAQWREIAGADDVQFVETLGMYEPRTYVRTIASNLYNYTRLYR